MPNGDKYVGDLKNGVKHDHGTYTWTSGNKYVGEWKDNQMHGQETSTLSDGERYVGEWEDGKRHGHGIMTRPDGTKYDGEWKNGERYDSNLVQLDWTKLLGSEKKNIKPIDKEAFSIANKIINQHWLIVEKSRKDDNYDNSWFTIIDIIYNSTIVQMKDVIYKFAKVEVNDVDRMNGIEWHGHFYLHPKFTRAYSDKASWDKGFDGGKGWSKWFDGSKGFGNGERNFLYDIWKKNGKWAIRQVLERTYYSADGWGRAPKMKKPKRQQLP